MRAAPPFRGPVDVVTSTAGRWPWSRHTGARATRRRGDAIRGRGAEAAAASAEHGPALAADQLPVADPDRRGVREARAWLHMFRYPIPIQAPADVCERDQLAVAAMLRFAEETTRRLVDAWTVASTLDAALHAAARRENELRAELLDWRHRAESSERTVRAWAGAP